MNLGLLLDPVIELEALGLTASHNIYYSKVVSDLNGDIGSIVILWEYERGVSLDKEANTFNLVSLEVNVLVSDVGARPQERTDPTDE